LNATLAVVRKQTEEGRRWGGYHQAPRNHLGVDNGVSSAWRNTGMFLIGAVLVPDDASPSVFGAGSRQLLAHGFGPWREVAPASEGGGSYLNEAHVMEPHWQEDFYGARYADLLKIKHKYDPRGLFYGPTAVGSENWEVRDGNEGFQTQAGRLCRK